MITLRKNIILIILIGFVFTVELFAADSVIVQTFTFDSILTRQAKFKFPDPQEKFSKVIAKYRLKCDPKTQHDIYDCGEWDYLAYTKIMKPTGEYSLTERKHPITTLGSFFMPAEGQTLKLTTTKCSDKYKKINTRYKANSNNPVSYTLNTGNVEFKSFANHQFLLTGGELIQAGLKANAKIGQIILDANIVDTMENVIVRVAQFSQGKTVQNTYFKGSFDTVCVQTLIIPQDCVNGKLTLEFMKDLVWDGIKNLYFEIIADVKHASKNTFKGYTATTNKGITGFPYSSAVLGGNNSWIDGPTVPQIIGNKNFTFEGWFFISSKDSTELSNAILFSIGSKVIANLGGDAGSRNKLQIEMAEGGTTHYCRTSDVAIPYDQWTHIVFAYDGAGKVNNERIKVYSNGTPVKMDYAYWGADGWTAQSASYVDSTEATFAVGRGYYTDTNKARKNLKACVSDIRVWSATLTETEVKDWMYKKLDNTHPKHSNLLINYECNEEYDSRALTNGTGANTSGKAIGNTYFSTQNFGVKGTEQTNFIPNLVLVAGDFTYNKTDSEYEITKEQIPVSVVTYQSNPAPDYPNIANVEYLYKPTLTTYGVDGSILSEDAIIGVTAIEKTIGKELFTYQSKHGLKYKMLEIGRYITPYGKGLSLGTDGFEWEYDFTDYMNELRGDVIISAHNLQELIDLKFIFYRGEPVREILRVSEPWGQMRSYSYKDLSDNTVLPAVLVDLLPETKTVKIKTRLTGHGAEGTQQEHCCEFYSNTHCISAGPTTKNVNGVAEWKTWQMCGEVSPVYPQGGTWPIPREGWCPGDVVKDYEFELTPYISNGKIAIDYDISTTGINGNPNMGKGSYVVAMQLVEYGESKYDNDLELYKVISPSIADLYKNENPICNGIKFIVRNNSKTDISNFNVIIKNESEVVELPVTLKNPLQPFMFDTVKVYLPDAKFWLATSTVDPKIEVRVVLADNKKDDNPDNNSIIQKFVLPDVYKKDDMVIKYKTNRRPDDYDFKIYGFSGQLEKTFKVGGVNVEHSLTLKDLGKGCYMLKFTDTKYYYGLSFWAVSGQGNGSIGIYNTKGDLLKKFNPDFGKQFTYSFVLDEFTWIVDEPKFNLSIYPNPSNEFLMIQTYENIDNATVSIFDAAGQIVYEAIKSIKEDESLPIDISKLSAGAYSVRIARDNKLIWNKFIKN